VNFNDLILNLPPPPSRRGKATHEREHRFYEGKVMLAYAMHLLRTEKTTEVHVHPDGMHGKQFDLSAWLKRQGFRLVSRLGKTAYGGTYSDASGRMIVINPRSGQGDVTATVGGGSIWAECKGGIINTTHAGQVSKLYRGLCETVGLLMATPAHGRQVAVVPHTERTFRLAKRLAPRCNQAGIELALVKSDGQVIDVRAT
jgi:hypothetical protein